MKKRYRVLTALGIVGALLLAACLLLGNYFCTFAVKRMDRFDMSMLPPVGDSPEEVLRMETIKGNRKAFNGLVAEWLPERTVEELRIKSADGLELAAHLIRAEEPTHRYVILCHGYQGRGEDMYPHAYVFNGWGYDCLAVDWKSHGESEGKWIGLGWKDKDDLLLWINEIVKMDPEAEIVLLGISMGGATVMMTSGLPDLPDNVVAVIEDCGYTNVWDVFSSQLVRMFGLPDFPVLHCASLMNRLHNGFFLDEADAVKMLEKTDPDLPMLFIHGEYDTFVPFGMLDPLFDAKRGVKEKLVVPDTDHGNSYVRQPELYFGTIREFLDGYTD